MEIKKDWYNNFKKKKVNYVRGLQICFFVVIDEHCVDNIILSLKKLENKNHFIWFIKNKEESE